MKKIIQIFAASALLLASSTTFAGTDRHRKPTDPAPEFASTLKTSIKPINRIGGEVILVVTVIDRNNKPVSGALVSAPCTGQSAKYTDTKGSATFQLGTTCPCSDDDVTVTTQKGCFQQLKVSCGQYVVECDQ
ncbi:MAG: hypothetical protein JSS76_09530 [Bacteroidetes bacterium]|nr:hypothetical protein [Bacteroidota bacterium]